MNEDSFLVWRGFVSASSVPLKDKEQRRGNWFNRLNGRIQFDESLSLLGHDKLETRKEKNCVNLQCFNANSSCGLQIGKHEINTQMRHFRLLVLRLSNVRTGRGGFAGDKNSERERNGLH